MINSIVFDREIDIYWDKIFQIDESLSFDVYLNGEKVGSTAFTHYEFFQLLPNTKYAITVVALVKGSNEIYKKYDEIEVITKYEKNRLDVSQPPFNAVGDGKTLNTRAIQAAIDACTEKDCVYIPAGTFLTGALDMKSNVELYVDKGAVLLGSARREDYLPKRISRFEGYELERYSALINVGKIDNSLAVNCQNVVIRGEGEIRGGGLPLADDVVNHELIALKEDIEKLGELLKTYDRVEVIPGRLRPFLIDVNNCDGFILTGLTVGYGACWNVHYCYSKNVVVSKCKIGSVGIWNGDGIDPDSSVNSVIYDIEFSTHDDAIAIKSGKNPEGNKINAPCKDLRIFHIRGFFGIAIGSELSGGIENVYIWDVVVEKGERGMRIKTSRDRGGYVKNVWVSNYNTPAFFVDTIYSCNGDGESASALTKIEDLYFENITINGVGHDIQPWATLTLYGFEGEENYIKNVALKNITVAVEQSGTVQDIKIDNVSNLTIENLNVISQNKKK